MRRFLERVLPERWMDEIREETRTWIIECPACGFSQDLWAYGGIRYRAKGTPKVRVTCAACGETNWMTVRRNV